MKKIFLLTDYRGQFYSSSKHRGAAVDIPRLRGYFRQLGFDMITVPYSEIDFRAQNFKDEWVLYQSSEDPGLYYRSYIEDVIIGLLIQRARLIPSFYQFRAHHNKLFMEVMRDVIGPPEIKNIQAKRFGTYEDYVKNAKSLKEKVYVLKSSNTSKSHGVSLLHTDTDPFTLPQSVSRTFSLQNLKYLIERLMTGNKPLSISNNRHKFILQPYIDGLAGDYRIIVYGEKFYVLYRGNRDNDFRASGSMKFRYDVDLPKGLLDFSKRVYDGFEAPYIALDIGVKGNDFYLFEFQFMSFGQYTLEKSNFFYRHVDDAWEKIYEEPDLEREISMSVVRFISNHTQSCAG